MPSQPQKSFPILRKILPAIAVIALYLMPAVGFLSQHQIRLFEDWSMYSREVVPISGPVCRAEFKYKTPSNDLAIIDRQEFAQLLQAKDDWGFAEGYFFRLFIYSKEDVTEVLKRICPQKNNEIYADIECFYQTEKYKIGSAEKNACEQL